jgi:hypothetical protein
VFFWLVHLFLGAPASSFRAAFFGQEFIAANRSTRMDLRMEIRPYGLEAPWRFAVRDGFVAPYCGLKHWKSWLNMCFLMVILEIMVPNHHFIDGLKPAWWFGTMEFYDFPFSWNNDPN